MSVAADSRADTTEALDAARDLAPEITARAEAVESARRVPPDLLEALRHAGLFRLLRPASHGGMGADLPSAMRVYEQLSEADASVALIVLIGGGAWADLAGLPRATFDAIFSPDADVIVAGVFSPDGFAAPDGDAYRVTGRWGFASGCEHADWIYGNCVDTSSGEPELRIAVFEPSDVEIEDTWSVVGLCGTGSHHFTARDVRVPAARTLRVFADEPTVDSPFVRIPVPAALALLLSAVPIGIARAALDDVTQLAVDKVPLLSASALAANPSFDHWLGSADASLRAARALVYADAEEAWTTAAAGDDFTPELRARLRSAALNAVTTATTVVDGAYRAGGGSSLYRASPLQRRLRDVHAVGQHFLFRTDTLTTCGAVLAKQDPELGIF